MEGGGGWGGAAGPSVYGVRREAPGADGAVSVQAQTVGRRRRAKGAATSESTPPTTLPTASHSSLFAFHCAHCGRINIVAEGYTDWRTHTHLVTHRCRRRAGELSRGRADSFRGRATIGSCAGRE